jgi:TP901 family phage tail tape measure protein
MSNLRTSVILDLAGNLQGKARSYTKAITNMAKRGSRSMNMLRRSTLAVGRGLDAMGNRYVASFGGMAAAYKGAQAVMASGNLDKSLIKTTQTAEATRKAAALLRRELHTMSKLTGIKVDNLLIGFDNLVQSGLSWEAALATIYNINRAMGVTGAQSEVLTGGLTVAAKAFDFDLTKVETSALLLDKMTVAGRLGNAELEDLAGIFGRVGVNAKRAGLDFDSTLGFIEELSLIEKSPERLATLMDSTFRLFTNQNYLKKASKVTKVSFYDADGERRAAFDVLEDIATKYKTLTTDRQRDRFIFAAFGDADLDTRKGLSTLLAGDSLTSARTMAATIKDAFGTIAKDLPGALDNSVDQVARLKSALGEAADEFAQPINDVIKRAIKHLLDNKKVSGTEMLVGGAVAGAALLGTAKLVGGLILSRLGGKLKSGLGGLAGGGSGPIPVYVVNNKMSMMPGEYGGGWQGGKGKKVGSKISGRGGKFGRRAAGGLVLAGTAIGLISTLTNDDFSTSDKITASGGAVGGGLGGWGGAVAGAQIGAVLGSVVPVLGTAIGAAIGGVGGGLAGAWAGGNVGERLGELIGMLAGDDEQKRPEAKMRIEVSDDRVRVGHLDARGMEVDVDSGLYMVGVGR